nr:cytochrome c oxidase subunit II [Rhizohabitans arisaemae]
MLLVSATACSGEEWLRGAMPENVTEQGDTVLALWQGSWVAAIAVGVVVWGLIIWACVFHRKRKGGGDDELPPQVRYNLPIETLYTVVPLIMVSVFFFFTARDEVYLDELSKTPDAVVKVEGFQWSWRFTTQYQGKQVTVSGIPGKDPQLVLPVSKKVHFDLHSPDVIHSFWVPAFLFKRDVIPGVHNKFQVDTLNKPGTYVGRCAELCGVDHSRMLFSVKLVPQAEFEQYIQTQSQAGSTP